MMAQFWQQQTHDSFAFANASTASLESPTPVDQLAFASLSLYRAPTAISLFTCTWGGFDPHTASGAAAKNFCLLTTKTQWSLVMG